MENQYRIGLVRMERAIKERMSIVSGYRHAHAA
jgi:DNA-directed RNA polymerase beta subunit